MDCHYHDISSSLCSSIWLLGNSALVSVAHSVDNKLCPKCGRDMHVVRIKGVTLRRMGWRSPGKEVALHAITGDCCG